MMQALAGYVFFHFLSYAVWFRHWRAFGSEKTIFLYHAVSFAGAVSSVLAASWFLCPPGGGWRWVTGAAGLHGIYSLSFLELWALSDGGYSLRILDQIERDRAGGAGSCVRWGDR